MGSIASRVAVVGHALLTVMMSIAATTAYGQAGGANGGAAASGAAKEPDAGVGSYSVVVTLVEASAATHLLNPAPTVSVEHASKQEPKDSMGVLEVAPEMAIEGLGKPRYVCVPAVPRDHGCEAVDRCMLTVRDPNKVEYHVLNHGAAVQLKVNVLVHDVLPVSREGAKTVWRAGDVIFISASKATPAARIVSTVVVGEWNHEAIVFEVGKPLPEKAQTALEDLGVKQDLGDKVLYSFRVKTPRK